MFKTIGCVQEVEGLFWHVRCNTKLKNRHPSTCMDIFRHLHNDSCDQLKTRNVGNWMTFTNIYIFSIEIVVNYLKLDKF